MYEIKILSNDEFNRVSKSDARYSYVDDSNMGFADPVKGVAYVRNSHIHDLNKYLVSHELEELESSESCHEDANGIRHKKFFKDLIMPVISAGLSSKTGGISNLFSPKQQAIAQPQSGSYAPSQNGGSPLASFSGNYSPANVPQVASGGSYQPSIGLGGGLNNNEVLTPQLKQRIAGNYAGRLTF